MTQDNNEQSANPFIALYQQYALEATQLGVKPYLVDQTDLRRVASSRIRDEHITDEAGKIKVYEEVKAQFKEYEEWLVCETASNPQTSKPDTEVEEEVEEEYNEQSEDITQDPEYRKGYERGIESWRSEHSPYHYGFMAGRHALDTPEVVESKAVPGSPKQDQQLDERLGKIEERLGKIEEWLSKYRRQ